MVAPLGSGPESGRTGNGRRDAKRPAKIIPLSFIRTVTVGVGVAPTLLTPPKSSGRRSRAEAIARHHRRWGLPPRPENVRRRAETAAAPTHLGRFRRRRNPLSIGERDDGNFAPVIRLLPQAGAAIGKEALGFRRGVAAAALDAREPEALQL